MRSHTDDLRTRGSSHRRHWTRWGPAGLVTAVIAAGSFTLGSQAGAAEDLPDKTAAEILALLAEHDVAAYSGTVEQTSELGIPQVPGEMGPPGAGGSSALELLTASHTARVYVDRPRMRVQILDRLGERDLVVTDTDVWFYDSSENVANRLSLPASLPTELPTELPTDLEGALPEEWLDELPQGFPDASPLDLEGLPFDLEGFPFEPGTTPVDLAETLLAAIGASTDVTVGADTTVAGRSAYSVVLTPLSVDTLVGSISVAVDAETGLPLSVVVRSRGQEKPAWSSSFTALSLETPDPARFEFAPPPGATIEDPMSAAEGSTRGGEDGTQEATPDDAVGSLAADPTIHGSGWDLVLELPAGSDDAGTLADPTLSQLLTDVPGGRALTTALVNVFLTDDGRLLVGSVTLDRLRAVAAE